MGHLLIPIHFDPKTIVSIETAFHSLTHLFVTALSKLDVQVKSSKAEPLR